MARKLTPKGSFDEAFHELFGDTWLPNIGDLCEFTFMDYIPRESKLSGIYLGGSLDESTGTHIITLMLPNGSTERFPMLRYAGHRVLSHFSAAKDV